MFVWFECNNTRAALDCVCECESVFGLLILHLIQKRITTKHKHIQSIPKRLKKRTQTSSEFYLSCWAMHKTTRMLKSWCDGPGNVAPHMLPSTIRIRKTTCSFVAQTHSACHRSAKVAKGTHKFPLQAICYQCAIHVRYEAAKLDHGANTKTPTAYSGRTESNRYQSVERTVSHYDNGRLSFPS